MKHNYIESLLSEIQLLESKVANLKENQNVSFSFFKESFKRTQEITRLLHDLEFAQIEEMKGQMEKLVHFLSEAETAKQEANVMPVEKLPEVDKTQDTFDIEEQIATKIDAPIPVIQLKEQLEEVSSTSDESQQETTPTPKQTPPLPTSNSILNRQKGTIVEHLGSSNRSLNDVQPVNHTIQDAKHRISLNDRFLFQRELFHNNREAMSDMLTKLQSFSSYSVIEGYLKENTHWNFKDETVEKFMQMLKDSFK